MRWVTLIDYWGKMKVKTVSTWQWNNLKFRVGQVPQLVKVPVYHAQSCKFNALASRKLGMVAHGCIPSTCDLKFWVVLSYTASLGSAWATWDLFSKCNLIFLCIWFPSLPLGQYVNSDVLSWLSFKLHVDRLIYTQFKLGFWPNYCFIHAPFLPDAICDVCHRLVCWLSEEHDSGCRKCGTKVFIWLKRGPRFHMLDPLSPVE